MGQFLNPFQAPSKTFGPVNGLSGYLEFSPFVATTAVTVGNSAVETSLLSTTNAYGTKTIPANYLSVGSVFKISLRGTIGTDVVVPLITIKAYYGATVLSTIAVTPAAAIVASTYFEYTCTGTVTAIGAGGAITTGQVMWLNSTAVTALSVAPASQAVATSAAGALDVKITWGTANANNTVSELTGYIEVIG